MSFIWVTGKDGEHIVLNSEEISCVMAHSQDLLDEPAAIMLKGSGRTPIEVKETFREIAILLDASCIGPGEEE